MTQRQLIPIPVQGINIATGEKVDGGQMWMLPAGKGRCEVCASVHEPDLPHNAQSLFYQTRFHLENGRSPSWLDAMEHCSDDMRDLWTAALTEKGVDVVGGKVNPA